MHLASLREGRNRLVGCGYRSKSHIQNIAQNCTGWALTNQNGCQLSTTSTAVWVCPTEWCNITWHLASLIECGYREIGNMQTR